MSDGTKIVEKREFIQAKLSLQSVPVQPPVGIHEGQHVALDRRGDGERGTAGQGASIVMFEARPGFGKAGIIARPVFAHVAELWAPARREFGQCKAGMGAADIGGDDPHDERLAEEIILRVYPSAAWCERGRPKREKPAGN